MIDTALKLVALRDERNYSLRVHLIEKSSTTMNNSITTDSRKRLRQSSTDEHAIVTAAQMILKKESTSKVTEDRHFREMFGCSAKVVLQIWNMINADIKGSPKIDHLLWSLMFLKLYSKETVTSRLAGGVDEKTYRKWVWIFVTAIADLEVDVVRHKCYIACVLTTTISQ